MAKMIILEKWHPINPMCVLGNGEIKKYIALGHGDDVFVKMSKKGKFYKGTINGWKRTNGFYVYSVELKANNREVWARPHQFKQP